MIQCDVPTNDNDDDEMDTFYLSLHAELAKVPKHDLIAFMGDMNAKAGADNTHNDRKMGEHGCGNVNENGEKMLDICIINDLGIGGTLFPHREIHKLTWCSPNGRDKNQIDQWRR